MGTYQYAAPEQFDSKMFGPVGSRTDVYALGCVLYHSLTGGVPFPADTPGAILAAHLFHEPPDLRAARPDLPPALASVVRRAMAKQPDDRYPTAGDLARAARAATAPPAHASHFDTVIDVPPPTVDVPPPTVDRPAVAGTGTGLAVLLAGGGALLLGSLSLPWYERVTRSAASVGVPSLDPQVAQIDPAWQRGGTVTGWHALTTIDLVLAAIAAVVVICAAVLLARPRTRARPALPAIAAVAGLLAVCLVGFRVVSTPAVVAVVAATGPPPVVQTRPSYGGFIALFAALGISAAAVALWRRPRRD
jgi:serine/threonine-protein kinase